MKITGYELFLVEPRWLFLRVDTDEGISGWGEPIVEGKAHTVARCVEEMFDYLLGQDPARIEEHWQVLAKSGFYRGGVVLNSALAGIDQALWDIAGKTHGVPVHQLLGGHVRDRVRDSPERARSLLTVRAAISSARLVEAPRLRALDLMA